MDPVIILAALEAVTAIIKQIDVYSRGQMTEEELHTFHARVTAFMKTVQVEADTLRKDPAT